MATTLDITTTYAGQFASEIILRTLKEAVTVRNNGVRVQEGIKKSWTISRLTGADLIANRTCDFTPVGTVTMDERLLTPKDLEVNVSLCKDDFRATQFAMEMGRGRNSEVLAASVRSAVLAEVGQAIAQSTETSIWHGVTATAGQFGGFIPKMTADATVIDVTGAVGGVTVANAIEEIGKVYDAIPAELLASPDMNIYISPLVYRAYQQALSGFGAAGLGAAGYLNQGTVGMKPLNFNGIGLFPTLGMTGSFMVAARQSNLWLGTDVSAETLGGSIKMIDQSNITGANTVNVVAQWAADANYGWGEEVVLYTSGV